MSLTVINRMHLSSTMLYEAIIHFVPFHYSVNISWKYCFGKGDSVTACKSRKRRSTLRDILTLKENMTRWFKNYSRPDEIRSVQSVEFSDGQGPPSK